MIKFLEHSHWVRIVQDVLDIVLVACLVYSLLRLIRGTRTVQMVVGLGIFILIYYLSSVAELYTLNWILYHFLESLLLILVILFQNEIRRFLTRIGQTSFIPFFSGTHDSKMVEELVRASIALSNKKMGALIVIERDEGLGDYIEIGVPLDANISAELLTSIFVHAAPLHDGAVIIQKGRVSHACCFLPLSMNPDLDSRFGTRHRAGVGLTEETDAIVICISEETGGITVALNGKITRSLDPAGLRKILNDELNVKISKFVLPNKNSSEKK